MDNEDEYIKLETTAYLFIYVQKKYISDAA